MTGQVDPAKPSPINHEIPKIIQPKKIGGSGKNIFSYEPQFALNPNNVEKVTDEGTSIQFTNLIMDNLEIPKGSLVSILLDNVRNVGDGMKWDNILINNTPLTQLAVEDSIHGLYSDSEKTYNLFFQLKPELSLPAQSKISGNNVLAMGDVTEARMEPGSVGAPKVKQGEEKQEPANNGTLVVPDTGAEKPAEAQPPAEVPFFERIHGSTSSVTGRTTFTIWPDLINKLNNDSTPLELEVASLSKDNYVVYTDVKNGTQMIKLSQSAGEQTININGKQIKIVLKEKEKAAPPEEKKSAAEKPKEASKNYPKTKHHRAHRTRGRHNIKGSKKEPTKDLKTKSEVKNKVNSTTELRKKWFRGVPGTNFLSTSEKLEIAQDEIRRSREWELTKKASGKTK